MIERLRWTLANTVALGRAPVFAAAMIGLGAAAALADAWHAHAMREDVDAQAFATSRAARVAPAPQAVDADVTTLLRKLPDADAWGTQVRQLFELAQDNGLTLQQGEYLTVAKANSLIRRLRITLPIKGEPAHIAHFVAGVSAGMPAVAVESISLKRPDANAAAVEAQLVLILFMNAGRAP